MVTARIASLTLALLMATAVPVRATAAGPTITGSVQGDLTKGSTGTLTARVVEPSGLQRIREVDFTMLLRNLPLVLVEYAPAFDAITVGGASLVRRGTPQTLETSFFRTSGRDVTATRSGERLDVALRIHLIQSMPAGTQFRFSVSDSLGASASFTSDATIEASSGFSWGSLAAVGLAALFLGGFVGGLFASRRVSRPKESIYDIISQRIEQERAGAPT